MKYVALLRGINVGGRSIKMSDLKACFEGLGYLQVKTVLQTGNVLFDTEDAPFLLKQTIESEISRVFGYAAVVKVIGLDELKFILSGTPFDNNKKYHSYIVFFENGVEKQLVEDVKDLKSDKEAIGTGEGVIYWQVPVGLTLKSPFAKYLSKAKYKNFSTNRNVRTLEKIILAAK